MAARWTHSWGDIVRDVIEQDVCTGCSGCVVACPQQVLDIAEDRWTPSLDEAAWTNGDSLHCVHSERGCTVCARACPRFRLWDPDLDAVTVARADREDILGEHTAILLVRTTDEAIAAVGQDGGLGTAAMLYALEHDIIDAAVVSGFDEGMRPKPQLARTRQDLLDCAGSRYTYSANTLAMREADDAGLKRLGLVSVGCQTAIPPVAFIRGARKLARRFVLTIGLLCSKTFADELYPNLLDAEYGVDRNQIQKVNIKGRLQVWHTTGGRDEYLEVPLKECRNFTRPGCNTCPDFSAESADLSLGGIGKFPGNTMTIVRTDRGRDLLARMENDGWITVSDATVDDPDSVALVRKLATVQKRRWPIPNPAMTLD